MPFTESDKQWFIDKIYNLDPDANVVRVDMKNNKIIYHDCIKSDESNERILIPEELVRALIMVLLNSSKYRYEPEFFYIEKYYSIGRPSSSRAEIDLIIYEKDNLAFSVWEIKSPEDFYKRQDHWIQHQLFDPAPLIGAPKYLVYATIFPDGDKPKLTLLNIDYQEHQDFDSWLKNNRPCYDTFPSDYEDEHIKPIIKGTENDLKVATTHKEFRALAKSFHQAFFGEKQDTDLFKELLKLFIAKIFDERTTQTGDRYKFQICHHGRKEESNTDLFERIRLLYKNAYKRYIEPGIDDDEIPDMLPNEFSPEKVKFVVRKLQKISLTRNKAKQGDIVGDFFEEILRDGFKQDKGMYFTHSNLVHFMVHALDINNLAKNVFKKATHHNNRMPYIIDPACGSGSFLLVAMNRITDTILKNQSTLVKDDESKEFVNHYLTPESPNLWAKDFLYGFDPKFVMALTSKVNMVLHGDGSAHIYKYDGLDSLSKYNDSRLNEIPRHQSTVDKTKYQKPVCERFDALITNPPFGITIDENIKKNIPQNFKLSQTSNSEALFFERWFQLLKPLGRLGVVLPESFFSTSENLNARILLYRFFKIKAIVSLPQNLFVDTPTRTSLLFAQKKTKQEIEAWEEKWVKFEKKSCEMITCVKSLLRDKNNENKNKLITSVLNVLEPIIKKREYIIKKGKPPIKIDPTAKLNNVEEVRKHFREIMKLANFKQLVTAYIFENIASELDYSFKTYCVDEVGYKLSKRNEKARPNQLCRFTISGSKKNVPNLHLVDENTEIKIDTNKPKTVLDYIKRDVVWE